MSPSEFILILATAISALAGVAFVWVMLQTYKGQMNAQVFTEYNNRYDQILTSLPPSARHGGLPIKKRSQTSGSFSLILAEPTGLEPATSDVTGRRSNQLNY